jgi:CubicO group peptidase (beta-lactamase class C family)
MPENPLSARVPTSDAGRPRVTRRRPAEPLRLPAGITPDRIRRHVLAPAHVDGVRIEELDPAKERSFTFTPIAKQLSSTPRVDLGALGLALHTVLKDRVVGYSLLVTHRGKVVHTGIWNWARTPVDSGTGWTPQTPMHVASVSKLLTAVGMVRALERKGLTLDDKVAPYLPAHFDVGRNIGEITFRHLLTHRSGFATGGSASDFPLMRSKVAEGVTSVGSYRYENMNFGLCRILIPIVNGDIDRHAVFVSGSLGHVNDQAWDAVTIHHFRGFMASQVFKPAGVGPVGFAPQQGVGALAYRQPHGGAKGWDSGDLATVAGGAGFRISAEDLLKVLDHVRRRGTILAPATVQAMLDGLVGVDQAIDTPGGRIYNKNGAWRNGSGTEQCVAYLLPHDMELALFVNSPIADDYSLRGLVKDAFVACLKG